MSLIVSDKKSMLKRTLLDFI